MLASKQGKEKQMISAESAMAGILVLLVDERDQRTKDDKTATKTEVLLGRIGIPTEDIAAVTGKNAEAVRKALQRARAS